MRKILKVLAGIVTILILLGIGVGAWYKLYFTGTPTYAIVSIERSITEHDSDMFQKHINLNKFLSKAFDDVSDIYETSTGLSLKNNEFTGELIPLLKNYVVTASVNDILNRVEGSPNRRLTDQEYLAASMINEYIPSNVSLKEFSIVDKKDDSAVAVAKMYDIHLDYEFILKLKMSKTHDGMWRVMECSNLKEYINDRNDRIGRDFQ